MTIKLFVAIDFDNKDYFKNLQEHIKKDGVRCTYPKQFHLTLKFLGDVEEKKLQEIIEKLNQISFTNFELQTNTLGIFPPENRINVVWIGLKESKQLSILQHDVETALNSVKKDNKPFHAHITLARVKNIKKEQKQDYRKQVNDAQQELLTIKVTQFKLIKSELTPDGPKYTDIEVFEAKE